MDPFSITASAITIIGTIRLAGKCVQKLRIIRQAPTELKHLLEEAVDIHDLLEQLQNDQPAETGLDDGFARKRAAPRGLARLIERTASKLHDLDVLIEHHSNQTSGRRIDHGNLGWARGQRKAAKLCDELKVLRLDITASLGADTSSTVKRVEVAIEQVNVQQAETARLLSTFVKGLALALPSTNPPPFEYAGGDGSLNCNFNLPSYTDKEGRSSSNIQEQRKVGKMARHTNQIIKASETNPAMQVYGKKSRKLCKDWCSCTCHQKKVLRIKQPFSPTLGSFSLSVSGLPWITPECDQKACRSRSVPSIAMTVNFPAWFWKGSLSSAFTYVPIRGPEINFKLPQMVDGNSKLWRFGLDGNLSAIQGLFSKGAASPWDVNPLGGSVLHYAAGHKHFKLCKFLVDEGAQTDIEDDFNNSPSSLAWDYVLSNRLTAEDSYLVSSTFTDTDFLQTRQFTILHKIVLNLVPKSLTSELDYTTKDLNAVDSSGRTCVSWAAARGDLASLQILLDYGADPNISDFQGSTPLHHVRHVACGDLLLSRGADLHARNSFGRTALHELCRDGGGDTFIPMLALLVSKGIDVDAGDHGGETALINAAFRRYTACAKYLLTEGGADRELGTSSGDRPVHFAMMCCANGVLRELLAKGADAKAVNGGGQTVLHFAAKSGDMETIEILMGHGIEGVDVYAKDCEGKSAWDVLSEREDDSEEPEFRGKFLNLLDCLAAAGDQGEGVLFKESFELAGKMAALDIGKAATVTCVTPLSSGDEDEEYDELVLDGRGLSSSLVFYDAVEELEHALPVAVA